MNEKIEVLHTLMNESLSSCGLPELSYKKTRVFVEMNHRLNQLDIAQLVQLTDDYGLLLPAIVLSDVNVDYATLLQNEQSIDVSGFVRYVDVCFIRMTQNKKAVMIDATGIKRNQPKDIRRVFVRETLEKMINTRNKTVEEIIKEWMQFGTPSFCAYTRPNK